MLRRKILTVDFQKAVSSAGLIEGSCQVSLVVCQKQSWVINGNMASVWDSLNVFQLVTRHCMLKNKELIKEM